MRAPSIDEARGILDLIGCKNQMNEFDNIHDFAAYFESSTQASRDDLAAA
jgi:hypothetical protein